MEFIALSPGRHGLSREQVRQSQRGRLLVGLAEAVAERGYAKATVADALKRAGVSRSSFYEHFKDKETCFLALLDLAADLVVNSIAGAAAEVAGLPPVQRFDQGMKVYLETLAEEWPVAKAFFLEAYSAGPAAQQRLFAVQERFAAILNANFAELQPWKGLPDPDFAGHAVSAALHSLVASALAADDSAQLIALRGKATALLEQLLES